MAMRSTALIPSTAAKARVCVDGRKNFEMIGTIYNVYLPKPAKFRSVNEIVLIMETIFKTISFPQSYCEERAFSAKQRLTQKRREETEVRQYMDEDIFTKEQGKKATFVIQVHFRQNATWQGTITWTDEKKAQRFRSTLEMLKLMGDAIGDNEGEELVEWE